MAERHFYVPKRSASKPGSQAMLGQYREEIAKQSRVRCRAFA